jgi:SPW repeat
MATDPRVRRPRAAPPNGAARARGAHPPLRETPVMPPEPPPRRGGWRDTVVLLSGLNVLAGIWLIIAPWVLNYRAGDPKWNDVVFGAIVALFGLVRAGGAFRESWLSWLNAAIGVWLFIAAFTIDSSRTAGWNDVILGVIVFVLAIGSASASEEAAAV